MKDKVGRNINYLRLSITDTCNLNCIHCMNKNDLNLATLTTYDIYKIIKVCSNLGVTKVRLVGGEPLIKNNLMEIIQSINSISSISDIRITTNGILLYNKTEELHKFGVKGVNINLLSLDFNKYSKLTSGGNLESVLYSINKALINNLEVKINTTLFKGINDNELIDFINLTENNNLQVRFIEYPYKTNSSLVPITNKSIMKFLKQSFKKFKQLNNDYLDGPASYVEIPGWSGRIGLIAPLMKESLAYSNRLSLNFNGELKTGNNKGLVLPIKSYLDDNISDGDLEKLIFNTFNTEKKKFIF